MISATQSSCSSEISGKKPADYPRSHQIPSLYLRPSFRPHLLARLTQPVFMQAFIPASPALMRRSRRQACPATPRMMAGPSQPPPPLSGMDVLNGYIDNILIMNGRRSPRDRMPVADGDVTALVSKTPFFQTLHRTFLKYGPIYKLAFGPKVFVVVQDPALVRAVLREESVLYDKGVLAEVLDEIMGKGLIPADYATWKIRRRAIVPGFHGKWLRYMTGKMAVCVQVLCDKLDAIDGNRVLDMETEYSSVALDIIGKAVFNFDFDSVTTESPIIKAVYRALKETEHRSMSVLPYWKIPFAKNVIPRLRKFYGDMRLINETLSDLIASAKESATSADLGELENRDYENVNDPSLLRFLVELRGEQTTDQQLRDDLMTLLIAGHETTAAVLTWATVELAKHPEIFARARREVDNVVGDRHPTYDDIINMPFLRRIVAETLRLYPAPPLLIRRLLADTVLPKGSAEEATPLTRGTDVFINVYSLHRSEALWDRPEEFDPDRWLRPHQNAGVDGWAGYTPAQGLESGSPLYPTEVNADFAFLPFGGGSRKCVGDAFAVLESVVALAMVIRRFDFEFAEEGEVEMTTGATIHTLGGLNMRMRKRWFGETGVQGEQQAMAGVSGPGLRDV